MTSKVAATGESRARFLGPVGDWGGERGTPLARVSRPGAFSLSGRPIPQARLGGCRPLASCRRLSHFWR